MAKSFVKTLKWDYAKLANRPVIKTLMAQLKDWFDDYNSNNSYRALGYLPPKLYREKRLVTLIYWITVTTPSFELVPKAHDGALVGQPGYARIEFGKITV